MRGGASKAQLIGEVRRLQEVARSLQFNFYCFMVAALNEIPGGELKLDIEAVAKLRATHRIEFDPKLQKARLVPGIVTPPDDTINSDSDSDPGPNPDKALKLVR